MKRSLAIQPSAPPGNSPETAEAAPKTLAEATYWRLRSDIVWGKLPPGSPLRSDELRAAYDVGISPLREALSRLAVEQLVTTVGQRGFRVAPITAADVLDVMETRLVIEREALTRSIKAGDLSWETNLVASFHSLSRLPIPHGPGNAAESWARHHRNFHMALLAACGSDWQLRLAGLLFDQAERYSMVRALKVSAPKLTRDTISEHKQILDAALARNSKAAVAALEKHYRATTKQVLAALQLSSAS
ncbi:GntR family transcriptional regulator [Microvirga alba]|uniref:FCD domain-containing protein n=1 Tax=Microvirga alba TaxID=2791025 RepID=A0A931BQ07_9HYPH|nr:FCD domain-containing protein [Microvirga alba]MBF9234851.1 FCD domain-containing protein [Microvirga alba]